jgi:hypothetical protein
MADPIVNRADSQIEKAIEDAIETLRWCHRHRNERKAIDMMRVVQANLNYLALALDWEMEGDDLKANHALRKVWWEPLRDDDQTVPNSASPHP